MALALMVCTEVGFSLSSGEVFNLFGMRVESGTELDTQASATEGATFSKFGGNVISGNSGTATFTFRDAGAAGNQTFQITGTGANEDATNTDVLTAGDLFNTAYADTGTNSVLGWGKCNVSFASGHGSFHGSASYSGLVFDVASSTRFIGLSGDQQADGTATEANVAFKARGYDTFEALQVRVETNARTNDSVFRNRINGGNGSAVITFGAGATGLVTATALADSIADGQTIDVSLQLLTGVEDLVVNFVLATLKSSGSEQDMWASSQNGLARTASSTAHYFPIGGFLQATTNFSDATARIKPGFAAVVSNLRCYLSANTYTGDGTLKLYQNGSAVLTTTITASGGAAWYENTSDTITIDADDELSFEFDEGTSGSITIHSVGITFSPVAGGATTNFNWMNSRGGWW